MVEVFNPNRYGGLMLQQGTPDIPGGGDVITNETLSEDQVSTIRFTDNHGVQQEISAKWLDPSTEEYARLQKRIADKYANRRVTRDTVLNEAFYMETADKADDWF